VSEDALVLRDVWKIYKTETEEIPVLKGINLSVRQGELAIIMGPSGSGKSTLLSIAGGLENPSRGNVIVGGVDITNLSEDELTKIRARKIGFVFQSFNLVRNLTALENVMMPLIFTGIYSWKQAQEIAQKMLELVGLKGHEEKFPRQLSGGQQQMVAIARALAPSPDIILMDEPTGSLDVDSASRVLSLVKWLNEAFGQTIVIVTHNPEIAELASRTFYIRGGQIFEQPPTTTLADKVKEVKASTKKGELEKLQLELLKIKLDALESAAMEGKISPEILDAELKSLEARIARLEKFIEK
jgi:putative ABC transport system ATP-binding protein